MNVEALDDSSALVHGVWEYPRTHLAPSIAEELKKPAEDKVTSQSRARSRNSVTRRSTMLSFRLR